MHSAQLQQIFIVLLALSPHIKPFLLSLRSTLETFPQLLQLRFGAIEQMNIVSVAINFDLISTKRLKGKFTGRADLKS